MRYGMPHVLRATLHKHYSSKESGRNQPKYTLELKQMYVSKSKRENPFISCSMCLKNSSSFLLWHAKEICRHNQWR